jgi:hypothetical protein
MLAEHWKAIFPIREREVNTRTTGIRLMFKMPTPTKKPTNKDLKMPILTSSEKEFLDVYLHEATTAPFFTGPASQAMRAIGVAYSDVSYLAWAYHHEVPLSSFEWGHAAEFAPPVPWATREAVLVRNQEIKRLWEESQQPPGALKAS